MKSTDKEWQSLSDTKSWLAMNPGYQYGLLGSKSADDFVNKHFSDNLSILEVYHTLQNPGMKTDLLRYLVMLAEGGVYSDLDTWALRPIDHWVPQYLRGSVRAVVGIEFDQLDGEFPPGFGDEPSYMTHVVQFCQWTLAAVPGHPIYRNMVDETVRAVRRLAAEKETTISNLRPSGYEVIITTGPAAWTDVVFRQLQTADPNLVSLRQLSNMTHPLLIGDVFATAPNSPATNPAVISATQGRTLNPEAIFVGTFQTGVVGGAAALSSASTITVTATFQDATTAQTTFNFDPPNTVFGLAISAEAMQYFQFPCEWAKVVSLSFRPQAENGLNGLLGLAIDNFQYIDDTSA
ncbi:hypothetical protein SLS63_014189 [Diaporthe eres]|uniref:Initiation-specific alpha-1,6-mannosyltransferase n=1 Tax=Diaporthe eres TaxID=83184 RepID=A0ABR1NKI2_DIAER